MKIRLLLPTVLLLSSILLSLNLFGQGATQQTTRDETPRDETHEVQPDSLAPQPFPAIGITEEIGTTGNLLNEALQEHLTEEDITAYTTELDTVISEINRFAYDSVIVSLKGVSSRELDQITQRAQVYLDQVEELQGRLSGVATGLESKSALLRGNRQRWQITLEQGANDEAVVSRAERIRRTIERIDSVKTLLENDLGIILGEQDRLTDKIIGLQEVVNRVKAKKTALIGSMMTRDMPGFFKDLSNLRDPSQIQSHINEFKESVKADLVLMKSGYIKAMMISLLMLIVLMASAIWLKKNHHRVITMKLSELSKEHLIIINSPVVSALFVATLLIRLLIPDLPQTFYYLNLVILMVPLVILMIRIFGGIFRTWIIVLVLATGINFIYELAYYPGILLRILLMGICFAGIWIFYWLYSRKPFVGLIKHQFLYKFFRVLVVVFLGMQCLAIIANLVGAFRMAEYLTLIPLQISLLAIAIQILTKVSDTILFMILSGNYLQKLNVVREGFEVIYLKILWLIDFLLLLLFLSTALQLLRIKEVVYEWGRGLLSNGRKFGAIDITLGSILIFFFVIWVSIMISRIVSQILEKDLFTRVKTAKGIPGTVSLLLRIALITGGFFLAAAASGMHLTNLSIVLGAFSVGIGFGLQNIFNNMVSGLILAFERPINVGDVIQVGDLLGTVRNIGLRSSNIKSFDGAEVIVPNGNLISNEMINWTLSDSYRRMDIRVGVAYGTDPERVLALMKEIAETHEMVRKDPKPITYFIEFGDSSLNFRLLAWVNFENRLEVESEINVLINKRLAEEGIEIPFPQRDLHIRSDATKADATKANAGKADATKSDATKADGGKPDAGKAGATKADGGKADATKSDGAQADATKAGLQEESNPPGSE
jgi:potassium-dependent mechanosensitive channel